MKTFTQNTASNVSTSSFGKLPKFLLFCLLAFISNTLNAATLTVTNTLNAGAGSLRDVVASAASGDIINFDNSLANSTISLSPYIALGTNLTIENTTPGSITLSGGGTTDKVFVISDGLTIVLNNLTVSNFKGTNTGALYLNITIASSVNNLTLTNCIFSNNSVISSGSTAALGAACFIRNNAAGATLNVAMTGCSFINNVTNANSGAGNAEAGAVEISDFNANGNVTANIVSCNFSGNTLLGNSNSFGGGLYLYRTNFNITGSIFKNNSGSVGGGLSVLSKNGNLGTISNCIFAQNNATGTNGGGIIFTGSTAGVITNQSITNCTFYNNSAVGLGAHIRNTAANNNLVIKNSVFKGGGSNAISNNNQFLDISYSTVEGGNASIVNAGTGTNNFLTALGNEVGDPLFVDATDLDGADNILLTTDDGLGLQNTSYAINAGDNNGVSSTDITGGTRIIYTGVDKGAYEFSGIPCFVPAAYSVTGGGAYCVDGTGVPVGLSNSQTGVNYQLQIDGVDAGSPVAGTAALAISFGNQTTVGTYSVVATTATGNCTSHTSGSVTVAINQPTYNATTVTSCDSYSWNGTNYTLGGDYTYSYTNTNGCASVDTLHLTINTSVAITDVSAANNPVCGGTKTILTANGVTGTNALVTWYDGPGGTGNVVGTGLTTPLVDVGTYYAYVTGDCGTAEASITLTGDTENPTLTCPGNVTANNTVSCTKALVLTSPTFNDNCKVKALSWTMTGATNAASSLTGIRPINGVTLNNGTTTITYTVKDFSNLTNTCSFTVTINNTVKPSFTTTPANINLSIPTGCSSTIPVPDVSFTDNCGTPTLTWVATGATSGNGNAQIGTMLFNIGTTKIVYTLTDANNNFRSAFINVKLVETESPTITCPANITTGTVGTSCTKNIAVAAPVYSDNCIVKSLTWKATGATILSSPINGIWLVNTKTFNAGLTTVTYTINDVSGNTKTCSTNVQLNTNNVCPSATLMARNIVASEEITTELKAKLSPNPTSSVFILKVQSDMKDAVEVSVYNSEGKKIQQLKTANLSNIILGEKYVRGSYLFEVKQGVKRTSVMGVKQ